MAQRYDAIVIGTGQSGPALAARLTREGSKTAVIERKLFGGTCVNVGCIPTKTLVASARAAYMARRGADFGVMIDGPIEVDMERVKARKDAVVRQSNEGVTNWVRNMPNGTVIQGHARFEGPHTVRVGDEVLEGDRIFINTQCMTVKPQAGGVAVQVECDVGAPEVSGSHLLMAVGRRPNTHDLGLDEAGIETDARGFIVVDDQLRTNVPEVWATGDVNGRGAFTHTSYNDHEIVVANLFDEDPRRVSDRITAYGLFIDPPLGRAGMTEREVRASGRPALVGRMTMARVGRARERSETQGFMKVIVDSQTEEILGAALLGIGGDEIIHSILDIMYAGAS